MIVSWSLILSRFVMAFCRKAKYFKSTLTCSGRHIWELTATLAFSRPFCQSIPASQTVHLTRPTSTTSSFQTKPSSRLYPAVSLLFLVIAPRPVWICQTVYAGGPLCAMQSRATALTRESLFWRAHKRRNADFFYGRTMRQRRYLCQLPARYSIFCF